MHSLSHQDWLEKAKHLNIATGLFLDGQYVPSQDGATFDCINPADGSLIAKMAKGQAADVDAAVASGLRAWNDRRWRGLAPRARMQVLFKFADLIEQHANELALLLRAGALPDSSLVARKLSNMDTL